MSNVSPIRLFIASSLVSCLSAMVIAWPVAIHAEDPEAAADAANAEEIPIDGTQIGDIVATTELVKNEKTQRHFLRFVAMNTSKDHAVEANIEVNVVKWESSPESRVSPPPKVAWERSFHIVLPAGSRDVREVPLTTKLVKALAELDTLQKRMEAGDPDLVMPPIFTSYEARVVAPVEEEANQETAEAPASDQAPQNQPTAAL